MMWSLGDKESFFYRFLDFMIDAMEQRNTEERVESPSFTTGELFVKSDSGKLLEICKKLRGKTLCSVLYAAGKLPVGGYAEEELAKIKKYFGQDRRNNVENMEEVNLFKIAAEKDLRQHTSLAYCVAQIEHFFETHPNFSPGLAEEVIEVVKFLDLSEDARKSVEQERENLRKNR